MADLSFVQKSSLFSYSGVNCIRNDYFHNDCQKCVDICPEGAFRVVRNAITLFLDECTQCSACIGSCPTEALTIVNFDPNAFVLSFSQMEQDSLSCKENTNCLGVFDSNHYIAMSLNSKTAPTCDLSHCVDCKLNKDSKVESFIRQEIEKTNNFLIACGLDSQIEIKEERPEEQNPRRAIFKTAFSKAKDATKDKPEAEALTLIHQRDINAPKIPLKFLNLKEAIKNNITKLEKTTHDSNFGLFAEKTISFNACTNCGDCVQFCPTDSLVATSDKQGINFNVGDCIACGICDHICKTDAITTKEGIDLIEFAYDRGKELVHYEMVMCHECRCPYPYRGGDPICDRCAEYTKDFANMFTLARDM